MENFSPSPKFNHLENGSKPITVCIGDTEDDVKTFFKENIEKFKDEENLDNVDYNANSVSFYSEKNMLNKGPGTYVISEINSNDKITMGGFDCIFVYASGENAQTGENISLLTHQDPKKIFKPEIIDFFNHDFSEKIQEIKDKSKKGSVDVVIIGGNSFGNYENFTKITKITNEICQSKLGFSPTVVTGPKEGKGWTNIFADNKNRRVYLFMPEQEINETYHDFPAKDVDIQIDKIKTKIKENEEKKKQADK